VIWSYVFIAHNSSRNSHEEIRQRSTDYFLSISIIVDFKCGNFDKEMVHKCLDASRLLFSPNVSKFEVFVQIFAKAPIENSSRQVDLVYTDGRTDGRQTEVTQLPIAVRL